MALSKASSGDSFRPRAEDWNYMLDAADAERERRSSRQQGGPLGPGRNLTVATVRNNSGADLAQYAAVAVRVPIILPSDNLAEFKRVPTFGAYIADADDLCALPQRVAILLQPLAAGKIGSACLMGVVPVQLDLIDDTDRYARLTDGESFLTSAPLGPVEILWADSAAGSGSGSGAGQTWALVRLGGAEENRATVRVTGAEGDVFDGFIQQWVGPNSYVDRDACWIYESNGLSLADGYYAADLKGCFFGRLVFEVTCCTGGSGSGSGSGSGPTISDSCGLCTTLPEQWSFTTGGDYANDGCLNCTSLNNQTYTVTYEGACSWKSPTFDAICLVGFESGPVFWHLFFQVGVGWRLALESAVTTVMIFDPILAADFACLGSNTFVNPTWNSGTCSSASDITVNPV